MWPFKKTAKLGESGFFVGFTDWHSHILPGVDDGIQSMSESLAVLERYEKEGIKRVWLTPHVMEDFPNTPQKLKARFDELKASYNGSIELRLASENMLDSLFEERLERNEFLPIGEDGKHLLVETSYMNPPYGMEEMVEGVFAAGYTPILAHPERYRYMDEDDYYKWKDRGMLFQINYMSLLGSYGEQARKKGEWMLKENLVNLTGSDIHKLSSIDAGLSKSLKSSQVLEALLDVAALKKAEI